MSSLLVCKMLPDVQPVATKSQEYTVSERKFIAQKTRGLLEEDVIEPSISPWSAQVLVTKDNRNHKCCVIGDFSTTVHPFTQLDANLVPLQEEMAYDVSKYKVYCTLDLKNAYHQIPIKESERPLTAFQSFGK